MALPKKNRLSSKKDIDRVFKNGRTVKGSFLFIRFLINQKENSRFAFIMSAKYIPLAVDRHRIKRMFSEKIRKTLPALKKNYDTIILIPEKLDKNCFKYLVPELEKILLKI
ncbi:MAG: ribonuclease P protein component [Candidatus Yanofskybacteria bacterium RIFCSPHIGHO2_02_FULL_41_11]|uniref:Ribonuclease P protein component n=1 Tax=Candidatus Yanofskybacteria bacterium RIFCSPHIGHO2_02_FULL_41_11 TaxID=1802675 RepID=A0A1F8F9U0_9BACT|nr:MAG: ribonuclease P protein component [Candidatus Yanofskybacteria bacterium RIFCSPHIGHO2_02_FULL_41_11]